MGHGGTLTLRLSECSKQRLEILSRYEQITEQIEGVRGFERTERKQPKRPAVMSAAESAQLMQREVKQGVPRMLEQQIRTADAPWTYVEDWYHEFETDRRASLKRINRMSERLLSPQQQRAITYYFHKGMSLEKIAKRLGLSRASSAQYPLSEAIKIMKKELNPRDFFVLLNTLAAPRTIWDETIYEVYNEPTSSKPPKNQAFRDWNEQTNVGPSGRQWLSEKAEAISADTKEPSLQ